MPHLKNNTCTCLRALHALTAWLTCVFTVLSLSVFSQSAPSSLQGAWRSASGGNEITLICSEKFFSMAQYHVKDKRFVETYGGSYKVQGDRVVATIEFHSADPTQVGTDLASAFSISNDRLVFAEQPDQSWTRLDDGSPGKLAGAWLITGRMRNGEMGKMTPGARRTMKILSGTRFQWIAYNVDTKEFSGTGGGSYTTRNGKYVEQIEFFSRDASRVGQSLSFDFSIVDGAWRHSGTSSRGEPIDEVWTKREKTGL